MRVRENPATGERRIQSAVQGSRGRGPAQKDAPPVAGRRCSTVSHQLGSASRAPSSQICSLVRTAPGSDVLGSGKKARAWPLRRRLGG